MIHELIQQLKQLKPGKGQLVVGDTTINYDITDHGYSIRMTSGYTPEVSGLKDQPETQNSAEQRAVAIKNAINAHVEQFKKDIDAISDEVFQETCELYSKHSPISLNELSKAFDKAIDFKLIKRGTDTFKRCVNTVIDNKIEGLRKQIQKV